MHKDFNVKSAYLKNTQAQKNDFQNILPKKMLQKYLKVVPNELGTVKISIGEILTYLIDWDIYLID